MDVAVLNIANRYMTNSGEYMLLKCVNRFEKSLRFNFIFLDFIFMIGFPGCAPVFTELNLLKVGLSHLKSLLH